jgi:hypothetical protein
MEPLGKEIKPCMLDTFATKRLSGVLKMNEFLVFEGCHNLTRYKKMEATSIVHKIEILAFIG